MKKKAPKNVADISDIFFNLSF